MTSRSPGFTERSKLHRCRRQRDSKRGTCCGNCSAVKTCLCLSPGQCQVLGPRCHELRINDSSGTWRVLYRINKDAIVILEVFAKKTGKTPKGVIATCRHRLKEYEDAGK